MSSADGVNEYDATHAYNATIHSLRVSPIDGATSQLLGTY